MNGQERDCLSTSPFLWLHAWCGPKSVPRIRRMKPWPPGRQDGAVLGVGVFQDEMEINWVGGS